MSFSEALLYCLLVPIGICGIYWHGASSGYHKGWEAGFESARKIATEAAFWREREIEAIICCQEGGGETCATGRPDDARFEGVSERLHEEVASPQENGA